MEFRKLKDHITQYPISEYSQDLLKVNNTYEGNSKKNPLDFIINTTIEKLQVKLLQKLRKEMRRGFQIAENSTDKLNSHTESNLKFDNSSSISEEKKHSTDRKTVKINKRSGLIHQKRVASEISEIKGKFKIWHN